MAATRTTPQVMKTKLRSMVPVTRSATPRTATSAPMTMRALRITRLEHYGGPVGHDLAHGLSDLRGVETHHDNAVAAHGGCVLDEAVDGLAARLFEELGVFVDLAADQRAQACDDIAAQPAGADDDAKNLTQSLLHLIAGDPFGRGDDHGLSPIDSAYFATKWGISKAR